MRFFLMLIHIALINEFLSANIALKRLLAGMNAHMDLECFRIGKWSPAYIARKRFRTAVRLFVSLQSTSCGQSLVAHITTVFWRLARVHAPPVCSQFTRRIVPFIALIARMRFHARMLDHMHANLRLDQKLLFTNIALIRSFTGVHQSFVMQPCIVRTECFATHVTHKRFGAHMPLHMNEQFAVREKAFAANCTFDGFHLQMHPFHVKMQIVLTIESFVTSLTWKCLVLDAGVADKMSGQLFFTQKSLRANVTLKQQFDRMHFACVQSTL